MAANASWRSCAKNSTSLKEADRRKFQEAARQTSHRSLRNRLQAQKTYFDNPNLHGFETNTASVILHTAGVAPYLTFRNGAGTPGVAMGGLALLVGTCTPPPPPPPPPGVVWSAWEEDDCGTEGRARRGGSGGTRRLEDEGPFPRGATENMRRRQNENETLDKSNRQK